MKVGGQTIQDPEVEAGELQKVLHEVGQSLQKSSELQGKAGLSYAQFKANFLHTTLKVVPPSHVGR